MATRSAEYKQVTVLFADVVRSMEIAATLDLELLREIMLDVVARSAAAGQHVGFAQRMEAIAPAGGVMLSESTAQLVEDRVVLSEPEWVRVKGSDVPVNSC